MMNRDGKNSVVWRVVERRDAIDRIRRRRYGARLALACIWMLALAWVLAAAAGVVSCVRGCAGDVVVYPDPVCEWCGEVMGEDYVPCRVFTQDGALL